MNDMSIEVVFEDDNGDEFTVELPAVFQVCSDCEGHGTVLNDSMRYHAYTYDDEEMHDPEFREEYFKRGGMYDVTCSTCKGMRVEKVVDTKAKLTVEQKEALEAMREREQDDAEYDRMCRMERMMGA